MLLYSLLSLCFIALIQSCVPTSLCFYCKLIQDDIPAHILAMIENAPNKRQKTTLIGELFARGKSGHWEMDTNKPIFKQELTFESLFAIL